MDVFPCIASNQFAKEFRLTIRANRRTLEDNETSALDWEIAEDFVIVGESEKDLANFRKTTCSNSEFFVLTGNNIEFDSVVEDFRKAI